MIVKLLVLPLILHVMMVFYIGLKLVRARIRSVRHGQTKISDIAANSEAWPRKIRQLGNNFDNQFQSPALWYGCTAIILALGVADLVFVGLSWFYLLMRLVHSIIHIGNNEVPSRMRAFLLGFVALVGMWLWLAARLLVLG
jgi:hypothetical protein